MVGSYILYFYVKNGSLRSENTLPPARRTYFHRLFRPDARGTGRPRPFTSTLRERLRAVYSIHQHNTTLKERYRRRTADPLL